MTLHGFMYRVIGNDQKLLTHENLNLNSYTITKVR